MIDHELIKKIEKTPLDNNAFKIMVRTIKDFGAMSYFKAKAEIITNCYHSRNAHVLNGGGETILQNMCYWGTDVFFGMSGIPDHLKHNVTAMFIVRLLKSNSNDISKLLSENFVYTFFDRLQNYLSFIENVNTCYLRQYDDEINETLNLLWDICKKEGLGPVFECRRNEYYRCRDSVYKDKKIILFLQ